MRRHQWIAAIPYGITAAVSVILGSIYLLRGQFMPYHSDALGITWAEVGSELQVLLVALMQVGGAGWLTLALALILLLVWPFRSGYRWARLGIPALIILFYGPTLLATISVALHTPATPPWYGNVAALASALVGLAIDFGLEPRTGTG